MGNAKGKQKDHRSTPFSEEIEGATSIGKHYFCNGDVYFVPYQSMRPHPMGYRYCDKCKQTNRKGDVLHLIAEARMWK